MTRFSDNIFSGFQGITSGKSSMSAVCLSRTHNFTAVGGTTAITQTGTFPPGTQNLTAELYIIQQASATVSDKITVSAGGNNLITIDQFGSALGYLPGVTVASVGRFTMIASACATVAPPATNQVNGGEIPYAVTFLPVSADKTGQYQICLNFNRIDATWTTQGPFGGGGVTS